MDATPYPMDTGDGGPGPLCPRCAGAVPAGARFCPSCGEPAGPPRQAPEARKLVTVVFCDLSGSTELSGRLDAEALRAVTLRYFAVMRDRLERHGGTVEKFIGDAVMAVFGVPVLHEDDAQRAVRAALEMLTALDGLNEELERDHEVRLTVRIGINTGEVVATGDPFARQVLVSGEVVNVAARLEQNAGPGEILIGPDTFRAVDRLVVTEEVGPLRLKGKAEAVTARRLLDLRGDDPAVLRRFDSPLVGRAHELREMRLIARRAVRGRQCQLLTLFGDAGIGKTRLARHWLAQAAAEGMQVGTGRCRPYGEGGSLLALADAVRPFADAAARDAREAAQGFGGTGPGGPGSYPDPGPDPDADRAEALAVLRGGLLLDGAPDPSVEDTCWAVTWLLEYAARRRPLVLTLDDCHWASSVLCDVVDHIVREVRDAPLVVLCTARPELLDRRPGWGGGVLNSGSLVVPPLGPEEVRRLAGHLTEVSAHAAGAWDALLDRAEGNPLYLEQLLAMVNEAPAPAGAGSLPPTLHALIAARIEALDHDQRAALDVAAVAGRDFTVEQVGAGLAGGGGAGSGGADRRRPGGVDVEAAVQALARRRLVEPSRSARRRGAPYRFAGELIREVAYAGMAKRTRAERHQRLADHLASSGGDPEAVGTHLERAFRLRAELGPADAATKRLRLEAARRLGAAGGTAMDRCDPVRAADLLERAVSLYGPGSAEGLAPARRLGETLFALGRAEEGRSLIGAVHADATAAGDRRTAAHARLYLAMMEPGGGFAASVPAARGAAPVFAEFGDDLGLARVELRLGQHEQVQGRYAASRSLLDRALAHAVAAGAGAECATALGALAVALWLGPAPAGEAVESCRLLLAEHAERRAVRAAVHYPLAVLHALRGEPEEAGRCLAVADPIMRELGVGYARAFSPLFAAAVETHAGHLERAEELLRESAAAAGLLGDAGLATAAARNLARVLLTLGRYDEAAAAVLTAGDPGPASPVDAADSAGVRARVLAAGGDAAAGLPLADQAVTAARRADCPAGLATALLDRAHVLAALGRRAEAEAAAAAARARFVSKDHLVGRGWADTFLDGLE
ncbi:adenylate/guanylate cyclase domain-containing protein [Streptomyces polygonati]|uniref:Adenylate/guanylate cyclase domain-containing protein n=1 Tax=Streptomyces polygonati TaxID=1617087 RepID=A0ABV8HL05_9ACTN